MGACFGCCDGYSNFDEQGWFVNVHCSEKNSLLPARPCNDLLLVRKIHLSWHNSRVCSFTCRCGMTLSIDRKLIPVDCQPLEPPSLLSPLLSSNTNFQKNECSIM